MSSDHERFIGTRIGDYLIEAHIGDGAMGTVFRAKRIALDMPVAFKILGAQLNTEDFRRRFGHEARCAAAVNHPNVMRVFDVGDIDGRPFLVAELIIGSSLADVLEKKSILPVSNAVDVCLQTLAGLDALADVGMVHRDVKPGNIMLTKNNQVKLIDLGLARSIHGGNQLTMSGLALGTPSYMPPEQWAGGEIDHRADQFALGVTMYTALTGVYPFPSENPLAMLDALRGGRVVQIHKINSLVPEALSKVFMRMLAGDADMRWPNARHCAKAITDIYGHHLTPLPTAYPPVVAQIPRASSSRMSSPTPGLIVASDGLTANARSTDRHPSPGGGTLDSNGPGTLPRSNVQVDPDRPYLPVAGDAVALQLVAGTRTPLPITVDPLERAHQLQQEGRIDDAITLLQISQRREVETMRIRRIRSVLLGLHRISNEMQGRVIRQRLQAARRPGNVGRLRSEIIRGRTLLVSFSDADARDELNRELMSAEKWIRQQLLCWWFLGVAATVAICGLLAIVIH
jgi:serine/threonine protein kinase